MLKSDESIDDYIILKEETVIQRVKPGSIADLDGRLKVGDHIIKV